MAEKAVVAFGRYLKLLRERRKLSLDDVVALTKAYPEPINKGYLSRAERGLSHIAFSKVVALGRAYEVPVDVFGEKLSLDLEVEQLKDPPVTEGKTLAELMEEAYRLFGKGRRLHAYAIRRDLLFLATTGPLEPRFRNRAHQVSFAALAHGVTAGLLSRHRLSLHEVEYSMNTGALEQDDLVRASIQLSVIYRRLGDLVRSRVYAEQAIAQASSEESGKLYADARFARARLATYEGHFDNAIESYKVAYGAYRKLHLHAECSRIMSNLADVYIRAGRLGAAERATASAERTAQRYSIDGLQSRVGVLRGILEAARGNSRKAVALWLEALEIAKRTRDREMTFSAEFQLFKNALQSGHSAAAAAFGRRLNRLWPWVASDDPDIAEFRRLWEANRPSRRRPVAAPQHANDERGNPPSADRL